MTLLPFLDAKALYDKYRLDEPWDSPHNKALLPEMPDVFRAPTAPAASTNSAYFGFDADSKLIQADASLFPIMCGRLAGRMSDVLDGMSNVLLVVETQFDCPWTKPAELSFDPKQPPPRIGGIHAGGFCAAGGDCETHWIPDTFDPGSLLGALQKGDGKLITFPPATDR